MAEIALENCCRGKALLSQCKTIWGYLQWLIACLFCDEICHVDLLANLLINKSVNERSNC